MVATLVLWLLLIIRDIFSIFNECRLPHEESSSGPGSLRSRRRFVFPWWTCRYLKMGIVPSRSSGPHPSLRLRGTRALPILVRSDIVKIKWGWSVNGLPCSGWAAEKMRENREENRLEQNQFWFLFWLSWWSPSSEVGVFPETLSGGSTLSFWPGATGRLNKGFLCSGLWVFQKGLSPKPTLHLWCRPENHVFNSLPFYLTCLQKALGETILMWI